MFEKSHLYLYKIFNMIPNLSNSIPMEIVNIIFDFNLELSFHDIFRYYIKQYSVEHFISRFLFEFDKDPKFIKKFKNKIYNIEFLNTHKKIKKPLHMHVLVLDHFKNYVNNVCNVRFNSSKYLDQSKCLDKSKCLDHSKSLDLSKYIKDVIKEFTKKKYRYGLIDLKEFREYFDKYFPHHYNMISYDSIYRDDYGNHIQNYNQAIYNMKNEVYSRLCLISKCYMKFMLNY